MKYIEVTDEWLYQYIPLMCDVIEQDLDARIDTEYLFSARFEKRMKRLLWKEANGWITDFRQYLVRVAIVCLCIFGVMFAITMRVEAYRNKLFQSVKEIWEDSIIYTYFNRWDEQSFLPHEPTYISEGYVEVSRITTEHSISIAYEDGAGNRIVWDQMLASDYKEVILDAEYDADMVERIDGGDAYVYTYEDGYIGVYYEKDLYIFLITADGLTVEEVYRILMSME